MARSEAIDIAGGRAPAKSARALASPSMACMIAVKLRVLRVVQMVGLGRGKQDLLHPLAAKDRGQKAIAPGAEGGQHLGHGAAQILHRLRALMDRPQHIDQHDLPVDPGEMVAKERLHDARFVGVVAPLHLAPQAAARRRWRAGAAGAKVSTGLPARSPGNRNRPGVQSDQPAARAACR